METRALKYRKVTITLPEDLLLYADLCAEREGTNRSQVISQALASRVSDEQRQLAVEGYQFYAREAEEFAALTSPLANEVLAPASEWSDIA